MKDFNYEIKQKLDNNGSSISVELNEETFQSAMVDAGFPDDVVNEIRAQVNEINKGEYDNFVFVFTEGKMVVTGIYVDDSLIDKDNEPLIFSGARSDSMIAAFSKSFVMAAIEEADAFVLPAGLKIGDEDPGDYAWRMQIEKMGKIVRNKISANPPAAWADTLAIPDEWTEGE